jgi:pimeloyl-ACP methyl ester carboxylesterase
VTSLPPPGPDLDAWADAYEVVSYDQRGRGRSTVGVDPDDVTLATDVDDLHALCARLRLRARAARPFLGRGPALAAALAQPDRVASLVLVNPAPVSARNAEVFARRCASGSGRMRAGSALVGERGAARGDPATVAARYRLHFGSVLPRPGDRDVLLGRLAAAFAGQGGAGVRTARAVEDRLLAETRERPAFDVLPRLRGLATPALVVTGRDDIVPVEGGGPGRRGAPARRAPGPRGLRPLRRARGADGPASGGRRVPRSRAVGRSGGLWTTDRTAAGPV